MAERENRVLWDYALPQASSVTSSIMNPAFEANNFELQQALAIFVEGPVGGHATEILRCIFAIFLQNMAPSSFMGCLQMLFE